MYYLIDGSSRKLIMALPDKDTIEWLCRLYNKRGRYVYVPHLSVVVQMIKDENGGLQNE